MSYPLNKRVLLGMSGGIDSSVAAALLLDSGYDVVGASIDILPGGVCSIAGWEDALAVCESLGIPHVVIDRRLSFKEKVVAPFAEEYASGRTPSPCVLCNERIKFCALADEARRFRCDLIATGHYARISSDAGVTRLFRAKDRRKDQSYFLYRVSSDILAMTIFPLGGMEKDEVRAFAKRRGLPVHEKPESQEACFVKDGNCASFVELHPGVSLSGPGNFVDPSGRILGRHRGVHAYTVGQRRGLGFGTGSRQYVLHIDPTRNEIVLGNATELLSSSIALGSVVWTGHRRELPLQAVVKIRSTHEGSEALIKNTNEGRLKVEFRNPVRAPAPGQAAVLYSGDELLGGGTIERSNLT
ncbi:MAG TPA: tRNA 2-thiouridine(34) synthase MnmA [bacterium]|nr:tRNA 2-thiouridine(34) synthase MnmA [bacterium]